MALANRELTKLNILRTIAQTPVKLDVNASIKSGDVLFCMAGD
jgi:hypothetical protein